MREKLVELLMDMPFGNSTEEAEERHARDTADYLIDNDVVPVVRCKDCKHYKTRSQSAKWKPKAPCCTRTVNIFTKPDDFCSYGERRE